METMKRSVKGFTLIEVMFAILFVALGVSSVVKALGVFVGSTSKVEQKIIASWAASNVMAHTRYDARSSRVKTGNKNQQVRLGNMVWDVKTKIEQTEVEDVFLITVSVVNQQDRNAAVVVEMISAISSSL